MCRDDDVIANRAEILEIKGLIWLRSNSLFSAVFFKGYAKLTQMVTSNNTKICSQLGQSQRVFHFWEASHFNLLLERSNRRLFYFCLHVENVVNFDAGFKEALH